LTCLGVEMHSLQRAARMRGLACGVWLRSSHRKRRVACPREKQPSSKSQDWAVTWQYNAPGSGKRKEADWLAARDCGKTNSLDRFRVQRRHGVREQRSHRRTLSPKSAGTRSAIEGARGREFFAKNVRVVHVNTRSLCDFDFVRGAADTDGLRRLRLNFSRRDPQIRKRRSHRGGIVDLLDRGRFIDSG